MNTITRVRPYILLVMSVALAASAYVLPPKLIFNIAGSNKKFTSTACASSTRIVPISSDQKRQTHFADNRREFISLASILATPFLIPKPSEALQSKNDNLCGTGFFEHFQEYRCTTIGDISDEGLSKDMNDSDKGLTDSLMGKLGVSIDDLNMEADKNGPKPGLLLLGEQNSRPKEKPVKK
jgi:hypothetical protein